MDFYFAKKREMSSNPHNPRKIRLDKWLVSPMLAWLLCAGLSHAAGLGRINVLSRLGQPFAAEIELINVGKAELGSLQVRLAPTAAYQAENLPFDPALNTLRLSLEQRANGTHYIRATSVQRVTEPYLHLLIDLSSPDSKFRRGYAALLDLPDVTESAGVAPGLTSPAPGVSPSQAPGPVRAPRASAAQSSAPAVTPAPAAITPAPVAPVPRAPVASVAPAKTATPAQTAVTPADTKPVEPAKPGTAKPETPKPASPESASAPVDAVQATPAQPAAKAPASAPATEPSPPVPAKAAEPAKTAQRNVNESTTNPLVLMGGAILALLAGIGALWAMRRRKQTPDQVVEPVAPTFTAKAADDSTSDAVAAARTAPALATTAMDATPGDSSPHEATVASVTDIVDPIEEARVYREYGQHDQAEKILREALSKEPGREDIQMQLLEVLAERGDSEGFNQLARRLHKQTGGRGTHWKSVMAMGFALDPNYPLYSPPQEGGVPGSGSDAGMDPVPASASAADDMGNTTDILLQREAPNAEMEKTMVLVRPVEKPSTPAVDPLPAFNFELPASSAPQESDASDKVAATPAAKEDSGLDFIIDFPDSKSKAPAEPAAPAPALVSASDAQREEIQQKIDLARAYKEMGDKDGALELLREVEREGAPWQQAEAREIILSLDEIADP